MARLVKRYGNRKLYDTERSRYVTLEDIGSFVKAGEDVKVIDNDSGEDLTAVTFAQIILEEERRQSGFLPVQILRKMIQQGEVAMAGIVGRVDDAISKAREGVQELAESAAPTGKRILDDLLAAPKARLDSLQQKIDERVQESVDRLRALPADLQKQVQRIEQSIRDLEERFARMRGGSSSNDEPRKPDEPRDS